MSETARVVAVVVTWNRKELLARNLRAVLAQTRPVDEILVVDNASTDGTPEMLAAEFPMVRVVRLGGNAGAAAGFYVGIAEGTKHPCRWLWIMDDDGFADPNCLGELLNAAESNGLAMCGPLILDEKNNERPAFPLPHHFRYVDGRVRQGKDALDVYFLPQPYTWNGILLRADVPNTCGLPKREMYLWGDDVEYWERVRSNGFPVGFALRARYFHPAQGHDAWWLLQLRMGRYIFRKILMCPVGSSRLLIHGRNVGFRLRTRCGVLLGLLGTPALFLRVAMKEGLRRSADWLRYYLDGLFDRYALPPSRTEIDHILRMR